MYSFHSVSIKGAVILDYELRVVQVPPTFTIFRWRKNSQPWTWKIQLPSYNSTHHSTHRTHCVTLSCTERHISYLCSVPGGREWLRWSDFRLWQPKVELCFQLLLAAAFFIWTAGTNRQKNKTNGNSFVFMALRHTGFYCSVTLVSWAIVIIFHSFF